MTGTNVSLYPPVGCIPYDVLGLGCGNAEFIPSLSNVTVIEFEGETIYDYNFTDNASDQPNNHTIWFTSDSVYCVSPLVGGYATCPVHPIEPKVSIVDSSISLENKSSGLRLDLQIAPNPAAVLSISIDEFNTLNTVNDLQRASNWAISPSELRGYCQTEVLGYSVYEGSYGVGNFTEASPLSLDSPAYYPICSEPSSPYYSFSPQSDNATEAPGSNGAPTLEAISLTDGIAGYWNGTGSPFLPSTAFHIFPPGRYTVVAVDEWGDVAALQFVVEG